MQQTKKLHYFTAKKMWAKRPKTLEKRSVRHCGRLEGRAWVVDGLVCQIPDSFHLHNILQISQIS